ncbi:hypothetical protein GCM10022215_12630 [Nocardioides fonticola]|uniref:Lipoprotein n=1 Tax=Nocardioides fonticola TaxID=450363 RepID=A0ABP7XHM1_9ACTN
MPHRIRRSLLLLAAVAVTTATAACGGDAPTADGPVIRGYSADGDFPAAQVEGQLRRAGDCLVVGTAVAVWTDAASWDADADAVAVGDDRYVVGTDVRLAGGFYDRGGWQDVVTDDAVAPLQDCLDSSGLETVALVR